MPVLAGVAAGFVWMASGELRADRDIEHELTSANAALAERLELQAQEIAELRERVESAATAGPKSPGPTQPGSAPTTKAEADAKELLAFRKKVLTAMKPELEGIDERANAANDAFDKHVEAYANHRHDYEITGSGWVRLDSMLTTEGAEMLRPSYANDWIGIRTDGKAGVVAKPTTKPK